MIFHYYLQFSQFFVMLLIKSKASYGFYQFYEKAQG